MKTLAQAIAANSSEFTAVLQNTIAEWCREASADKIKTAFFPERAGVEIHLPEKDDVDEPPLQGCGEIYFIRVNAEEPYSILQDESVGKNEYFTVPFLFHNKETARAMCDAHGIPYGNIYPVEMWKLDR
jgi:hypothetical protein